MTTKAMTLETTRAALEDQLLDAGAEALPIRLVASEDDTALEGLSDADRAWVAAQGWKPTQGAVLLLPGGAHGIGGVLLGTGGKNWAERSPLLTGALPGTLPEGDYRFASPLPDPELAALGFLAGSYRFTRYKTGNGAKTKRLVLPEGASRDQVLALAEALYFGRDLINTPANDLGPAELETAARELANAYGGSVKVTEGSGLLSNNFPMIHAVGRASDRAPRLIDLRFGSEHAPKVTIVGKGICFDTGGLDIKPSSGMAPPGARYSRYDVSRSVIHLARPVGIPFLTHPAHHTHLSHPEANGTPRTPCRHPVVRRPVRLPGDVSPGARADAAAEACAVEQDGHGAECGRPRNSEPGDLHPAWSPAPG